MAKFVVMLFLFLAINIGTSGSVLQKKEHKNGNVLKIEPKIVHDLRTQCQRDKSVDPEMNMDCCRTGNCGVGLIKFASLYYCDGKHLFSSGNRSKLYLEFIKTVLLF